MFIHNGRAIVRQYHRKHWVRWMWFRLEPLISSISFSAIFGSFVFGLMAVSAVGGFALALFLVAPFIH
jgi:hypothetical protein